MIWWRTGGNLTSSVRNWHHNVDKFEDVTRRRAKCFRIFVLRNNELINLILFFHHEIVLTTTTITIYSQLNCARSFVKRLFKHAITNEIGVLGYEHCQRRIFMSPNRGQQVEHVVNNYSNISIRALCTETTMRSSKSSMKRTTIILQPVIVLNAHLHGGGYRWHVKRLAARILILLDKNLFRHVLIWL